MIPALYIHNQILDNSFFRKENNNESVIITFKLVRNIFVYHNIKCMQKNWITFLLYREYSDIVVSISSIVYVNKLVCMYETKTEVEIKSSYLK